MSRKKVSLSFITNDSARKATLKKRKKGLLKKVEELSTLCGVDACAIIYSPYDGEPGHWPDLLRVQNLIARFKRLPEMEQSKKMVNQESFLRQRIIKVGDQLKKIQKDNREKEISNLMHLSLTGKRLGYLNIVDRTDLCWMVDQKIKGINRRLDELRKGGITNFSSMPSNVPERLMLNAQYEKKPSFAITFDNNTRSNIERRQQLDGVGDILPFECINKNIFTNTSNDNNHLWSNGFFPWEK